MTTYAVRMDSATTALCSRHDRPYLQLYLTGSPCQACSGSERQTGARRATRRLQHARIVHRNVKHCTPRVQAQSSRGEAVDGEIVWDCFCRWRKIRYPRTPTTTIVGID
jgi:hypothetical protein